jgi:NADPH-dependent 2,4-dienoyl-CoA reductase/sulfur reductase-like enzyme
VTGVRLGDGEVVPADIVVVGIGVVPNTGWLEGSGLELRDGVVCDETLWTGVPGIYAAGDCARWTNPLFGEEARIEHWTVAAEQGTAAATNLLAVAAGNPPTPYASVPFFWSIQYGARIQFLGRAGPDDEVRVVTGTPAEGKFVALYGNQGKLHGALGVGLPKLLMPYRTLIEQRVSWPDALAHAAAHPA